MFRSRQGRQESGGHGAGTLEKKTKTKRKAQDTPTETAQQKPIPTTGRLEPVEAPVTLGEKRGPFRSFMGISEVTARGILALGSMEYLPGISVGLKDVRLPLCWFVACLQESALSWVWPLIE
ncbi:hypothetical protein NDU88_008006 [Pleurodeles waltl]|uniref:Uncharacterized protein n=1 Tax=Pleurodeles waltl TaxID=8319 RepID=A0AAV7NV88_PLEWA|nr:hypothetical protein NDU88_008006 [Pleurodeles waltl]